MHLPVVVALQVLIAPVALPWPVKYLCICLIVMLLVFLSYHYLVRGTFIGAQLNGRRYPRVWPWEVSSRDRTIPAWLPSKRTSEFNCPPARRASLLDRRPGFSAMGEDPIKCAAIRRTLYTARVGADTLVRRSTEYAVKVPALPLGPGRR